MTYVLTILILAVVLNVKVYKTNSNFFNITLNLLTLVSIYASVITNFNSIYCVLLFLLICTHWNKLTLSYDIKGLKSSLIYSTILLPIVYIFQYKNLQFEQVPYLDDVFYARIPVWLDELKVETPLSHLEWMLNNDQASPGFYHWFEIWFANLCDKINNGNMYINLYIVVFTIVSVLITIGIQGIVEDKFKGKSPYKISAISILAFLFIVITNNITDLISIVSPVDISKFTNTHAIYNTLKILYVVPVCISIYYITAQKEKGLYYPFLFSFMYLIILPAVLGATILCVLLLIFYKKKIKWEYILPFIGAGGFLTFYVLNGDSNLDTSEGSVTDLVPTVAHTINWFIKSFLINPVGWIIPLFYLISKRDEYSNFIIVTFALYLSASGLWLLLYTKLDSFQLFYNIINPFFGFITALAILDLLRNKRYVLMTLFLFITIFPLEKINSQDIRKENKIILDKIEPYVKEKILYLNNPQNVNTIYRYNEVFYSFQPEVFIKYEDIQMMYLNASYPLNVEMSKENLEIFNDFRKRSKYFQQCGEMDFQDYSCMIEFMKEYGFTTIFSEIDIDNPSIQKVEKIEYLNIYQIR